ncbi:MAG: thioredoxin-disulfide reductase, partial [Proteobacteria bacterium]|nr:thioredoxin-disulfide reductase [Candidatus Fonsibacter sp. PEL5]
ELKAEKLLQKKLFSNPKINVIWDSVVSEIIGTENPKGVTGVKLKNIKTNTITEIQTHGLFVAIGHDPATALFKGQINMDSNGYIITQPDSTKTNVPGVFAAGDVKDKLYRQAVTAAGMGCMAALEAERHLSNH